MNMTDDAPAPTSSTATQKPKLVWSTPRVVTIGEPEGKDPSCPYEYCVTDTVNNTLGGPS